MKLAKRHHLAVASMGGRASLTDGLTKRSNHDRIEVELKASIETAAEHGIPGLICLSGNRQPHQSDREAIEAVADGLRRAAPYAETHGVNLNLELLNSKTDHPGYACDHTAWGMAVCERVGSPRVKLLYDIYHRQIMEGDVIRTVSGTTGPSKRDTQEKRHVWIASCSGSGRVPPAVGTGGLLKGRRPGRRRRSRRALPRRWCG